jgi:hypothetical protein
MALCLARAKQDKKKIWDVIGDAKEGISFGDEGIKACGVGDDRHLE